MSTLLSVCTNKQFQSVAVSHLATTLGFNLIIPVFPVFLHSRGFTETEIGIIIGITAASSLLTRPWVGLNVDKNGSRPAVIIGQILLILSTIGYLGAAGFLAFFCLRLLFGISLAFYGTGAVTFASSVETGEKASSAITIYTLTTMLAVGIGTSISQTAFDRFGLNSVIFLSLALIGFALSLMTFRSCSIKPAATATRIPFMSVLRSDIVQAATVAQFAANFTFGAMFTFVPLASLEKSVYNYSLFFISFAILVAGSRILVPKANRILGLEKTSMYGTSTMALGTFLLMAKVSPLTLILAGGLFGIGFGAVFPSLVLLILGRTNESSRGTALSILTAAGDVGNALAAAILGIIAEHIGYSSLFAATGLILLTCTYYFYSILSRQDAGTSCTNEIKA